MTPTDRDWFSNEAATFGDRLAAARDVLGMSDAELARRIGVKLKTVRNWEQDVAEPRANKLNRLAGVLNVSFRWLLTGEGDGVDAPGAPAITEDTTRLLTELRQLRSEMLSQTERLGRLEKRLAAALRDAA